MKHKEHDIISLFLITDNLIFRELFSLWISENSKDLSLIGSSGSGVQAFSLIEQNTPDIILIDLDMPNNNSYKICEHLLNRKSDLKIIVFSGINAPGTIAQLANMGVSAYLTKSITTEVLVDTIQTVHFEGPILHPYENFTSGNNLKYMDAIPDKTDCYSLLSKREAEILRYVASGQTNRDIANTLRISEHTIRNHISSIFHKLGVKNRTEAAILVSRFENSPKALR